jgi:hypothetical protein
LNVFDDIRFGFFSLFSIILAASCFHHVGLVQTLPFA